MAQMSKKRMGEIALAFMQHAVEKSGGLKMVRFLTKQGVDFKKIARRREPLLNTHVRRELRGLSKAASVPPEELRAFALSLMVRISEKMPNSAKKK